jgi:adenosylhomocysteine nucleosidase
MAARSASEGFRSPKATRVANHQIDYLRFGLDIGIPRWRFGLTSATMLQYLLQQWIRQAAQAKLLEAMAGAGEQSEAADDAPPTPVQVAILFALNIEAAGALDAALDLYRTENATFVEHVGPWLGKQVCVAETGAGYAAARRATSDLIAIHKPQWVISAGFAGGLADDIPRGHFVMADTIEGESGEPLSIGFRMDPGVLANTPKLHVGKLVTVKQIVRTSAAKRALAESSGAIACDMESAAIAEACREAKTRFLSVRIISDGVNDELPKEIERLMTSRTLARQLGAATGAIFKRPAAIKDLWRLREDALKYSDRLAKFLAGVIPQLR